MFDLDGLPDPETGKMPTTKYNYYHINYRSIVNIVKELVNSYDKSHAQTLTPNPTHQTYITESTKN